MPETRGECIFYKGQSMYPTFRFSDQLEIAPYRNEKICCGDVVVFISPRDGEKVVHRVIYRGKQGVKTMGDNNNKMDAWSLKPSDILGRVVRVRRGNRIDMVPGGARGCICLIFCHARRIIRGGMRFILRHPYRRFFRIGILKRMLPYCRMRVLVFDRPSGKEAQVIIHNRVVARMPLRNSR